MIGLSQRHSFNSVIYFVEAERRCEGLAMFIREERPQMAAAFDSEVVHNTTAEECQLRCLAADAYLCRSVTFDPATATCVLSSEDSTSSIPTEKESTVTQGSGYQYFEVMCTIAGNSNLHPLTHR